ncbi:hypothetical protein FNF29_06650 [Cafeteria roenbergensis]|uniref:Uncharacterized protein n=1 Tax=Cafeteria roenbergensis TaxID=33653 RepID=A0A5A8C5V8_CAFRO|nr:hypothetical protein FNF29_06650 [Cafeteria roenbergensis]KAA0154866.1 hypothetical protein FNF31_06207 [Cafeteria roenbergensis]KAA0160483.1 hypothetical protein FNF28_05439 [Cafeteria roenbergensis]|eukprot:KAA0148432.1 hypothetical protein FNF29_06650 [Cafeteria roenbergensis]
MADAAALLRDPRFRDLAKRLADVGALHKAGASDAVLDTLAEAAARFAARVAPAPGADASAEHASSLEAMDEAKSRGNQLFRERKFLDSAMAYGRALAVCPAEGPRAVLLANRAAALSECGRLDDAESDARLALRIRPDYAKAWARLGHVMASMRRDREALAALSRALELDPSLSATVAMLETVRRRCR